jgi:type IV pilus assembly protein PilP
MKSTHILTVLLGATALFMTACEEEDDSMPTAVVRSKAQAAAPVVEPDKKPADTSYSYEVMVGGVQRRDPFKTYYEDLGSENPLVDTSKLTELQKIDLDKLKLVGVVVGTATPMALVEDPSGRGHTVKIGTLVGKRLGQVKHIRRGEMVVQEEFRDFTGKRIPQLKEMKLDDGTVAP